MRYFDLRDLYASTKWIFKEEVSIFEKEFAKYVGARFAIGTSLGTTALYAGLKAINIENKEVIIPSFICTVVIYAVRLAGGIPRFVDVNLNDFTYDINDLKNKITSNTGAIILVHYFGRVARNFRDVHLLAKQNNLVLIEDCAHSLGAELDNQKIGSLGDFSIFSFTKSFICLGGGALVTNNQIIYESARKIVDGSKYGGKTRIADFPFVIVKGLEQIIEKVIFERVGRSIFKWWLIKIPKLIIVIRNCIISLVKLSWFVKGAKGREVISEVPGLLGGKTDNLKGIDMELIVASVARSQLRKVDHLIQKRKEISSRLAETENYYFRDSKEINVKEAYTHAVFRFRNSNIFEVMQQCRNQGVGVKLSWPCYQTLSEEQNTINTRIMGKELLILNVNPDLSLKEVNRLKQIIRNVRRY